MKAFRDLVTRQRRWAPTVSRCLLTILVATVTCQLARCAQYEEIFTHQGVRFSYVIRPFTPKSPKEELLLKLENLNDYKIEGSFRVFCVSGTGTESLDGGQGLTMRPRQVQSGELSGLFFLPLPDGEQIETVQLVDVVINRVDRPWGEWRPLPDFPFLQYHLRCGEFLDGKNGYNWHLQLKNTGSETVHLDYGLCRTRDKERGTFRIHLPPGESSRDDLSRFLRVRPKNEDQVSIRIRNLRVGAADSGSYVEASAPPKPSQ
jgi:hypothetical protein